MTHLDVFWWVSDRFWKDLVFLNMVGRFWRILLVWFWVFFGSVGSKRLINALNMISTASGLAYKPRVWWLQGDPRMVDTNVWVPESTPETLQACRFPLTHADEEGPEVMYQTIRILLLRDWSKPLSIYISNCCFPQ